MGKSKEGKGRGREKKKEREEKGNGDEIGRSKKKGKKRENEEDLCVGVMLYIPPFIVPLISRDIKVHFFNVRGNFTLSPAL